MSKDLTLKIPIILRRDYYCSW